MMQLRALALTFAVFSLSAQLSWSDDQAAMKGDDQIVSKIHHVNQHEITLAKLAEDRSTNDSVLGYARRIVDDHGSADQKTLDLAARTKLKISDISPTQEEKETRGKLTALMGEKFDREFLESMRKDHEKVISWMGDAQKKAEKTEVKDLIGELLPTLHHHHDLAVMMEKQEKKPT